MVYPGYQLNPGDMFQVEPERVLYATGAPKNTKESRADRLKRRKPAANIADPPSTSDSPSPSPESVASDPDSAASDPDSATSSSPSEPIEDAKEVISSLLSSAKTILATPTAELSAKRKQELRSFQRTLRRALSRPTEPSESVDAQFLELSAKLGLPAPPPPPSSLPNKKSFNPKTAAMDALSGPDATMLREALTEARENPIDPTKPYATPWRPRDYMSPFAFIPRYLEVHHRICSAVYLRHPVARPGLAEVPTPFGLETNGLAHNWYLRRR